MDTLKLTGELTGGEPLEFSHDDLFAAPAMARVDDVGELVPGRSGRGVRFSWIVQRAAPRDEARWVTLSSRDAAFSASLQRDELSDAVVVHADGDRPFEVADGGPFRLYIPGATDACGNVKHLGSIEFSATPGADTRPPVEERSC